MAASTAASAAASATTSVAILAQVAAVAPLDPARHCLVQMSSAISLAGLDDSLSGESLFGDSDGEPREARTDLAGLATLPEPQRISLDGLDDEPLVAEPAAPPSGSCRAVLLRDLRATAINGTRRACRFLFNMQRSAVRALRALSTEAAAHEKIAQHENNRRIR